MKCYSYAVPRDYGFAPNPFGGFCTLATCKPVIRKGANVGNWIFGCGSSTHGKENHLIYAMRVTEKLTFDQYWSDPRFQYKKPVMNGSLKKMYGDNIYYREGGNWHQENSHHSYPNGEPNNKNIKTDTSTTDNVLVSDHFYYFGNNAIPIPNELRPDIAYNNIGQKCPSDRACIKFIEYLDSNFEIGIDEMPIQFEKFERYEGK